MMLLGSLIPRLPDLFNIHEKERGEPGIQSHMRDIGPYTRVGSMTDRKNCAWVSVIFERCGLIWVRKKATLIISEGSTILRSLAELCFVDQRCFAMRLVQCHFPQRLSCDFGSQAPPLFLMYIEKIGEPGDEASS